jgi:hypothetical protein
MFTSLSLRWKILFTLIGVSVVPLAVALLILSGSVGRQLEPTMQLRAVDSAGFVRKTIDYSKQEASNYIRFTSQAPDLANSITCVSSPEEMLDIGSIIERALHAFKFDLIRVLNVEGGMLRSSVSRQYQGGAYGEFKEHSIIQAALIGDGAGGLDQIAGRPAIIKVVETLTLQTTALSDEVGAFKA